MNGSGKQNTICCTKDPDGKQKIFDTSMLHPDAEAFEPDEEGYEEATQLFYQSLGCAEVERDEGGPNDDNIVMFKSGDDSSGPPVPCVEQVPTQSNNLFNNSRDNESLTDLCLTSLEALDSIDRIYSVIQLIVNVKGKLL